MFPVKHVSLQLSHCALEEQLLKRQRMPPVSGGSPTRHYPHSCSRPPFPAMQQIWVISCLKKSGPRVSFRFGIGRFPSWRACLRQRSPNTPCGCAPETPALSSGPLLRPLCFQPLHPSLSPSCLTHRRQTMLPGFCRNP